MMKPPWIRRTPAIAAVRAIPAGACSVPNPDYEGEPGLCLGECAG